MAEVAGRHAARGQEGQAARVHGLLDGLAVDGVHPGAAHPDVVEGLGGHVDVEALLPARAPAVDDRAHLLDLVGEVGGDGLGIEQVERPLLQADQLGGVLRHVEPVDLVDLGPAARELVEGLHDDLLARRVALEVEGAGADRIPLELVVIGRGLLGDDVALLVADHAEQEDRVVGLERDLHGVRVEHLDGLDDVQVHAVARARGLVDLSLEAELHVLGRHLAEALVELHALLELERPERAVGRQRPALGQVGLDLGRRDLAVLDGEPGQPPEHEAGDGLRLAERARVRVERVRLLGRDVEDLLLGPGGRRVDEGHEGEGNERDHQHRHEREP